jgi:hypothetical protein
MSRVGLGKRLATVEQTIQARFPFGYAVHNLPEPLHTKYVNWCRECETAAKTHGDEPGDRYAALLHGESLGPPMPRDLRSALRLDATGVHEITSDMTVEQAAEIYNQALEQGGSTQ